MISYIYRHWESGRPVPAGPVVYHPVVRKVSEADVNVEDIWPFGQVGELGIRIEYTNGKSLTVPCHEILAEWDDGVDDE